ncbi:ExeM/NucH family extracellular endonuclease [Knoellia sp. S7-12]|uniref:ExeM/NucH family extracellular endonuclease n=1 Tax=Knoellia sp. S7-12 TaxID=3126698 RepID=UPI00336912B4
MSRFTRRTCAAIAAPLVALPLAGATALLAAAPASAASTTVLISEVYGGGGNSGATYTHDFIELRNVGTQAISLAGWSVQYASASGTSWQVTPLSGSIAPGANFLVQEAQGAGGTTALPTPDATGTIPMSGSSGKVALVSSASALTCGAECDTAPGVVDFVGFGSANDFETSPTRALSNTTSASRTAGDTDNNAADFTVGAPTPVASGGGTDPDPDPEPTTATIAEIQGTGPVSPLADKPVETTGVVTAVYPTGGFNGFYMQTPGTGGANDATPGASDGIFVFRQTDVEIGDCLTVSAKVIEFNGLTELTDSTLTEAVDCAPVTPTPLATLPVTDAEKEQYEGMLVQPQGTYTITNNFQLNNFGQIGLAVGDKPLFQSTDKVLPGAAAAAYEAENLKKYITLDDGASVNHLTNAAAQDSPLPYLSQDEPMRTGSQVSFGKPVILDYRFQWNYQPTGQIVGPTDSDDPVTTENDRELTPPSVGGNLKLATFNVLNYFPDLGVTEDTYKNCDFFADRDGNPVATDFCEVRGAWSQSAFKDQESKIVTAIKGLGADVISLEEIENSARISYLPGQPRDKALATLVTALNAGGGQWAYVQSPTVTPSNEDVIRTAFIYRKDRAMPLDASQILLDGAFANARYPLAQKFKALNAGSPFVVIANHFKSKGSGPNDGTGQGNSNPSRIAQAKALATWANTQFADEAVFLVGDFNAYSKEDPVREIEAAGYTNLADKYEVDHASYQFSGRLGSLDHGFANAKALKMVTGAGVWDINGDESVAMQYSRRNYNVTDFFTATTPFASSDHDPLVIGLQVSGRGPR